MKASFVSLGLVFGMLAGCSSSGGQGVVDVGVSSESSALTAPSQGDAGAPTADATHLRISVTEVDVQVAGSTAASPANGNAHGASSGAADDGGGWSVVFTGNQRIDLLDAAAVEAFLGGAQVPAGPINQIRLVLGDDATLVENGTETPLSCASCTTSGLKIVTEGGVTLAAGDHLHLQLAIDPAQSVVIEGAARVLRPVVRLADARHE